MTTLRPISRLRCQAIFPIVVVLPVPLTPTIIRIAGSAERSIGARPVEATSARISINRSRTATPSIGTAPDSTSCSSFSTTAAVVGAPTSARIKASSSNSQVSSSIRSKRLAEISSVSAWRLLERLSRNRLKTPRRTSGASSSAVATAEGLRAPRSTISCQLVAMARKGSGPAGRGGYPSPDTQPRAIARGVWRGVSAPPLRHRRQSRSFALVLFVLSHFTRQFPRNNLGDPVPAHADAVEDVGGVHRPFLVGDDDELGAVGEAPDQLQEAVDVRVVEGGLDLVEDVEGARPGEEDGEDEGQRDQRLLAAGEQLQFPRRLAGRGDLDLDPLLVALLFFLLLGLRLGLGVGRRLLLAGGALVVADRPQADPA